MACAQGHFGAGVVVIAGGCAVVVVVVVVVVVLVVDDVVVVVVVVLVGQPLGPPPQALPNEQGIAGGQM